ncbi:MAG: hypothetical protein LJE68_00525, partial [Rhodobacter sp.]|nr:hypothetical protein [Rhodobacter sp.]
MKIALICLGLIAAAIVLASAVGSYLFARRAAALADRLQNAPAPVDASARLPEKIRDFAVRSGARTDDLAISVAFSQSV